MTLQDWQRFKRWFWSDETLGVSLDVSRMAPDTELLAAAQGIPEALGAMAALENGSIANPDEKRRVGHYWLRDPDLAPADELSQAIRLARERVERFATEVREGRLRVEGQAVTDVLLIGIGGSALGPQFLADALGRPGFLPLHVLDNTDPDGMDRLYQSLGDRLSGTLCLVVSKSGGTKETRNGMLETRAAFAARGLDFARHAVAVTGEGSALEKTARDEGFLEIFPMWDWVGGRTSLFSAVGLLPAALGGVDVDALLAGARAMDVHTRHGALNRNPAALLAVSWFAAGQGQGARAMVVLPYKDRLLFLGRYLQQLVMESLGKALDLDGREVRQGLTVYGNKGSTDQHAYVQQLRDGPDDFFAAFVDVLRHRDGASEAMEPDVTSGDYLLGFLLGTRRALSEAGRRSLTLTLPRVDAASVGALVALFERAVGLYASLIRVNAYHQPGVEAGKVAAGAALELWRRVLAVLRAQPRSWTAPALAEHLEVPRETEVVWRLLEHAAANGDHGVTRRAGEQPWDAAFTIG